ncbi:MAG TPA: mechanosensitive ion channel family protein [Planctomycetaceae bacterium]|nr:mechanosensitive ion channel family protein [Planctomycetaceae bacterium]
MPPPPRLIVNTAFWGKTLSLATRPLQQWTVKRELLRRIKVRFDQEGIEIPSPQMTLHYKNGSPTLLPGE